TFALQVLEALSYVSCIPLEIGHCGFSKILNRFRTFYLGFLFMPTKDINLLRKYRREWYYRNKEHARSKVKERRNSLRQWLQEKKSKLKCTICDETHIATLDFHHIDPSKKDICLGRTIRNGWAIEKIETEIAKCIVLCANCHRKHHW